MNDNFIDDGLFPDFCRQLYASIPGRSEDPVLNYFMKMRNIGKYEREALRALHGVYHTAE